MIRTVTMDPPWPEQGAGKIKRGADRHYSLIKKKEDILRVVLQSGVWPEWKGDEGAHLYMWVTNNYLEWGLWLMDALGFKYKTNIVWVKTKEDWPDVFDQLVDEQGNLLLNPLTWMRVLAAAVRIGIGQYFRGSHELLLFGVRGQAMMPEKALPSVFHAPREKEDGKEKHSKKPVRSYEIIEATSPGPYLEIFARSGRKNWKAWGNEHQSSGEAEDLPNNFLPDGYTDDDECPNCHTGTVEQQEDGLYACRGECGALFQGPRKRKQSNRVKRKGPGSDDTAHLACQNWPNCDSEGCGPSEL